MGYETYYTLTIQEPQYPTIAEIIAQLRKASDGASYAIKDDGSTYDRVKWYDHVDDMKAFSRNYPDHLFILDGIGEDSERFRIYFKNGKTQDAQPRTVYDDFDPGKLK